ncbi:MAG: cell division protein FtsK [Nocardioides sp.]
MDSEHNRNGKRDRGLASSVEGAIFTAGQRFEDPDPEGTHRPPGGGSGVVVSGEVVSATTDDPATLADPSLTSASPAKPTVSASVTEPDEGPVPGHDLVNAPEPPTTVVEVWRSRLDRDRRPVVPAWLLDRAAIGAAARWAGGYYVHLTAFHTARVPLYWARLAAFSPAGLGRVLLNAGRWVFETDQADARRQLTAHPSDTNAYLRLRQDRRDTMRLRLLLITMAILAGLVTGLTVMQYPWPVQMVTVMAGLAALGWYGRGDRTVVSGRAVDANTVPRLTADLIVSALSTLGLGELNKAIAKAERDGRPASEAVGFPAPITRDGPGWRADIDLPGGVTAGDVIERRDRLASGLRRQLGCVWPEPDHDVHSGRLVLWVGDKALSAAAHVPWPLAKTGRVNLFEPVPLGADQRGRPVTATLMFASGLIGAIPRMGKTFYLRLLVLAAGLDPRCEVHVYNLKGGGDLDCAEAFAHRYRAGDSDDDIAALIADAREVQTDMRRRYTVLRELPKDVCPESKITDDLATRRSLRLHPVLFAVDECQIMFEHPLHGAELVEIITDLVKRGPAVGVMVWLATQRIDAKSIPTGISANAVLRLCLKVMGQVENDMVLGTSAYKAGIRATMFGRKDQGVALFAGEGDDPVIARGAYIDAHHAEAIAARAKAVRVKLGLLTGVAAGEAEPDSDTGSILDHLHSVWPAPTSPDDKQGTEKLWCDELAERLAGAYPGLYTGWSGVQVTNATRPHGLRTVQVKRMVNGQQVNKRGLTHTALTTALGYRNDPPPPTDASEVEGEGPGSSGPDPDPG